MTQWVLVKDLKSHVEKAVEVRGWISNLRSSGKLWFIEIRDGSGYVQAVVNPEALPAGQADGLSRLTREGSLIVSGVVSKHPKRADEYELQANLVTIIDCAQEFPIGKKEHGPDFLLEHRHLWLRSKKQWAIQRIRTTIIRATHDFLFGEGFTRIDSPIITANACEGTTTLFELDYFDLGKGYLSQSGQLYLEAAIAAHGRVFDFGPVFRAEKSKTRKHLSEFWMMDAEMAFFDHQLNLDLQERLIFHIVQQVLTNNRAELVMMERDISKLEAIKRPFPRITHLEAVHILRDKGSEITEDMDLGAGDEQLLAQVFDQPLFIEYWPAKIKAFYMKRRPDDPRYVACADLMAPEGYGELIGGSQREDNLDWLIERMNEEKVPLDVFQWYLDTRRYGSVPHAGFGFGLERLVTWLSGAEHIRETIPFPRMLYRFTP